MDNKVNEIRTLRFRVSQALHHFFFILLQKIQTGFATQIDRLRLAEILRDRPAHVFVEKRLRERDVTVAWAQAQRPRPLLAG